MTVLCIIKIHVFKERSEWMYMPKCEVEETGLKKRVWYEQPDVLVRDLLLHEVRDH